MLLLRHRSPGILIGSFGTMAFELAVLGGCFRAFGFSPALGVLVLGPFNPNQSPGLRGVRARRPRPINRRPRRSDPDQGDRC